MDGRARTGLLGPLLLSSSSSKEKTSLCSPGSACSSYTHDFLSRALTHGHTRVSRALHTYTFVFVLSLPLTRERVYARAWCGTIARSVSGAAAPSAARRFKSLGTYVRATYSFPFPSPLPPPPHPSLPLSYPSLSGGRISRSVQYVLTYLRRYPGERDARRGDPSRLEKEKRAGSIRARGRRWWRMPPLLGGRRDRARSPLE